MTSKGKQENDEAKSVSSTRAGKTKSKLDDGGEEQRVSHQQRWEEMFERLKEFKRQKGHCRVPNRYTEDTQLGSWVSAQRRQYRIVTNGEEGSAALTPDRANRLLELGFEWTTTNPHHTPWEVRYKSLQEFVKRFGHAEVPMRWAEDPQLSHWVSKMRHDYKLRLEGKSGRLSDERLKLLNEVGFRWEGTRRGIQKKTEERGADHAPSSSTTEGGESAAPGQVDSAVVTPPAIGTTNLASVVSGSTATQPPTASLAQPGLSNEQVQQLLSLLSSTPAAPPVGNPSDQSGANLSNVMAQLAAAASQDASPGALNLQQPLSLSQQTPGTVQNPQPSQPAQPDLAQMLSTLLAGAPSPAPPPVVPATPSPNDALQQVLSSLGAAPTPQQVLPAHNTVGNLAASNPQANMTNAIAQQLSSLIAPPPVASVQANAPQLLQQPLLLPANYQLPNNMGVSLQQLQASLAGTLAPLGVNNINPHQSHVLLVVPLGFPGGVGTQPALAMDNNTVGIDTGSAASAAQPGPTWPSQEGVIVNANPGVVGGDSSSVPVNLLAGIGAQSAAATTNNTSFNGMATDPPGVPTPITALMWPPPQEEVNFNQGDVGAINTTNNTSNDGPSPAPQEGYPN